jgi:hypothetical protein
LFLFNKHLLAAGRRQNPQAGTPALRDFAHADTRRDVIATVFRGVQNRMVSGYRLRDVINKLNGIHFTASDELHTLGGKRQHRQNANPCGVRRRSAIPETGGGYRQSGLERLARRMKTQSQH